tara:strand:- start:3139 stop:3420 length:282 start_codon:yes stop_codon:yes gene_type:complete
VHNNAMPMLCFVQLLWALSPTGQLTSRFAIEAMTIQQYMQEGFSLQVPRARARVVDDMEHRQGADGDPWHAPRPWVPPMGRSWRARAEPQDQE